MAKLISAGPATGSVQHVIELQTGILSVRVDNSDLALDQLCGFAARRNPKRGFLFVSRVLGKHIPVRPCVMRDVHTRLAAKISADLPGPVAIVGMAETAIGLGHGVYEEYLRLTGRTDTVFVHSTRYRLNRPAALEFLEEHSHAADHIIYTPQDAELAQRFSGARTVVLVDDEASTGKTFINLANAFKSRFPLLEQVVTVVITDWRGHEKREACHAAMPVPASSVSVLQGQYSFQAAPNLVAVKMPDVTGNGGFKDAILQRNYGRLGLDRMFNGKWQGNREDGVSSGRPRSLHSGETGFSRADGNDSLSRAMTSGAFLARSGAKHLILGTGEFAYPPFLLAEHLEKHGFDVRYQSTTRSPIMLGGAIGTALTFQDNYEDGIANFLYNASADMYDRIIVCHETPTVDEALVSALSARTLEI